MIFLNRKPRRKEEGDEEKDKKSRYGKFDMHVA